jgi:hypothetical protein
MTGDFEVIGFHLTGNGSTPAMGRLLKSFETAAIPVRVEEMQLTPLKEGTDNLKIELSLSTLCQLAPTDATAKTAVTDAGHLSEARSWNE